MNSLDTGLSALPVDGTAAGRREMYNDNRLKIGLFGANCSSGRCPTTVPERWRATWDESLSLARQADAAGIDFMLPIGRWKGYGGETDFEATTWESITWATALLASTQRLTVLATIHVPLLHPVVACKQMVTADHVGKGRFGLNIVCGWNQDEFGMFGATLDEHEQRYAFAQEWIDVVERLWTERGEFDFSGEFFQLRGLFSEPKPYGGGRPLLINAGTSPTGRAFAGRNCDALFCVPPSVGTSDTFETIVEDVNRLGAQNGHELGAYTVGVVVCRQTSEEARSYFEHAAIEHADTGALDAMIKSRTRRDASSFPEDELAEMRRSLARGWGGMLMVGNPDEVAEQLADLSAQGVKGVALSFVNYAEELPFFCDEVLPRLKARGVRA